MGLFDRFRKQSKQTNDVEDDYDFDEVMRRAEEIRKKQEQEQEEAKKRAKEVDAMMSNSIRQMNAIANGPDAQSLRRDDIEYLNELLYGKKSSPKEQETLEFGKRRVQQNTAEGENSEKVFTENQREYTTTSNNLSYSRPYMGVVNQEKKTELDVETQRYLNVAMCIYKQLDKYSENDQTLGVASKKLIALLAAGILDKGEMGTILNREENTSIKRTILSLIPELESLNIEKFDQDELLKTFSSVKRRNNYFKLKELSPESIFTMAYFNFPSSSEDNPLYSLFSENVSEEKIPVAMAPVINSIYEISRFAFKNGCLDYKKSSRKYFVAKVLLTRSDGSVDYSECEKLCDAARSIKTYEAESAQSKKELDDMFKDKSVDTSEDKSKETGSYK